MDSGVRKQDNKLISKKPGGLFNKMTERRGPVLSWFLSIWIHLDLISGFANIGSLLGAHMTEAQRTMKLIGRSANIGYQQEKKKTMFFEWGTKLKIISIEIISPTSMHQIQYVLFIAYDMDSKELYTGGRLVAMFLTVIRSSESIFMDAS
ncbi:hypothetical protein ACJX0J_014881 [Zea mays]